MCLKFLEDNVQMLIVLLQSLAMYQYIIEESAGEVLVLPKNPLHHTIEDCKSIH